MLRKAVVPLEVAVLPVEHIREGGVEERERMLLAVVAVVLQAIPVTEGRHVVALGLLAQVVVVVAELEGLVTSGGAVV